MPSRVPKTARKLSFSSLIVSLACTVSLSAAACGGSSDQAPAVADDSASEEANVVQEEFGVLPDGQQVSVFTLTNANGIVIRAIDYGGIIVSIMAPDREGEFADIVLGYDDLGGYLDVSPYFGAVIGRYGNRIAGGRFTLDGTDYELATNDNTNHLHGGNVGYDKVLWSGTIFERADGVGVTFAYESAAGEEGYPGALSAEFDYFLSNDDELVIDYRATTDAPTPVNLTHHTYFNLAGSGDVLGHELMINADRYTPVDATLIPTGEWAPVAGTPFDFTVPTAIGARIGDDDEQLVRGLGYDHNFVLVRDDDGTSVSAGGDLSAMVSAARVVDPVSGRVLEVETTEPGLQFYSGNFLDGTITGKRGQTYEHRSGFCLESQHFPDSPNQPGFPSTTLRPGEQYRSRTIYRFGADR